MIGRGHIDFQDQPVSWRGLEARYSLSELDQLRGLPEQESFIIHTLKALFGGEVFDPADPALGPSAPAESLETLPETTKGPPRRKRDEPLPGQATIAA